MPIIGCNTCDGDKKTRSDAKLLASTCTCNHDNSCNDSMCAWYIGQLFDLRTV